MQLQFTHQDYQTRAVQAVVQVFKGQPLAKSDFALAGQTGSVHYAADGSIANALHLTEEQILANVQQVQQAQNVAVSPALVASHSDNGKEVFCRLNFTIEMETGTGKTYTFIKTMYELHQQYGFKKFVVVVPSVAIREGTMKNLAVTRAHFAADYQNIPCVPILYDSGKLTDLRHFAQSDALSVLVINIDSFTKDNNKINQKGERAFAPIEYIKAVNPIVIVDEPQNFETDIRRRALGELNPLCTLRYSATHKNPYNLLYALNPVQAYDLGLVKQIEVDGVLADDNHNDVFIELVSIDAKARGITAKLRIHVNGKTGPETKEVSFKPGDDVYAKSKQRDIYASGYILNEIRADAGEVEFSGGRVLHLHEQQGGLTDDVMRFQIERTVAAHFAKLKNVQPMGVKVLSLFFIDKVANYRSYDEDGNPVPGKFALWFEEAFHKYAQRHPGLINHPASAVHDGYFSGDKKGKGAKAQTVWVDTKGNIAKDDDTYALIMQEKERLLSTSEPLQFIFSHSALREGWDNPNVFQICTLNAGRKNDVTKRQEIGRGLRLAVNQQGERVHDKRVNVLTVIPNESYEAFARSLQQEIEEETGASFTGRVKNARAKARIQRKPLNAQDQALFDAIWQKINYQTRYSVKLDTAALIADCVQALGDTDQYPQVQAPKVRARKAKMVMTQEGVHGVENAVGEAQAQYLSATAVPDVYAYIQNRVHVSRSTLFAILDQSGRLPELLVNPQAFLDMAVRAIQNCLQALLVQGIEYHVIHGRRYEMTLFDETVETYLSSVYPPANDDLSTPVAKTLLQAQPMDSEQTPLGDAFDCVLSDSDVESRFAQDCSNDERVRFFFKLPSRFKINTPLGGYNPDWAVVFEGDARVYFVAETKSSLVADERRRSENLKIDCGRAHFKLAQDVEHKTVTSLQELVA